MDMIRLMVKSRCRFPEHHTVIGRWTQDKKNIPVSETSRLESGFTLIELMVVLLIMGILMAIAVPTFIAVAGAGKDKAAQSDLTNAMTAVESYYTNNQYYSGISTSYLDQAEPSLQFVMDGTPASTAQNQVGFENWATGNNVVALYSWSATGICWLMAVNENGYTIPSDWGAPPGISYGYTPMSSAANCANGGTVWPTDPGGWHNAWPAAPPGQ
jgi:prepilin-type N-terminal cleavage/methylation domain-containing protein